MNGNLKQFERGVLNLPPLEESVVKFMAQYAITREGAEYLYRKAAADEVWINNEYQVNIDKRPDHAFPDTILWHLSIKRLKKTPVHDWRDLQAIKNMLVGKQYEAVELYPSSERVVDQANQYHLWVFIEVNGKKAPRLPLGWATRLLSDTGVANDNSRQRGLHSSGETL